MRHYRGLWLRPELTKTSISAALSERIPTAEAYYGYSNAHYPEVVPTCCTSGIPLFRENPQSARRQKDGSFPRDTPYQWIPMSLAGPWWDRIIWPTLEMTARLGFDRALVDGGFAGMQGVDYTPMHVGKANGAVAVQPYWWRWWRTLHHVGIRTYGECTTGFKGGNVSVGGSGDDFYAWMFQMGMYLGGGRQHSLQQPREVHRLYQLYNSIPAKAGNAAVRSYARQFYETHRAPDWIELKDLRQLDMVESTVEAGESPVAGDVAHSTSDETLKVRVRPWTWSDAVWHYDDAQFAVYPAYEKIDWQR